MMSRPVVFAQLVCLLLLLTGISRSFGQSITSVSPPLGSTGEQINILGSGFAPGGFRPNSLLVKINSTVITTDTNAVAMDSKIQTTVPAGAATGYISVRINGGPETFSPQPFTVVGAGPYITN